MTSLAKLNGAESTEAKQKPAHLFKPGQSGNPLGRPRSSRNRLGEDFLRALADDFTKNGVEAIEAVRLKSPKDYLKVIASLLPRGVELDVMVDATPELRADLAQFTQDYLLVKQAMKRLGVANELIDAIVVEDDGNAD